MPITARNYNDCVSQEIQHLINEKKYDRQRAIAASINMCKKQFKLEKEKDQLVMAILEAELSLATPKLTPPADYCEQREMDHLMKMRRGAGKARNWSLKKAKELCANWKASGKLENDKEQIIAAILEAQLRLEELAKLTPKSRGNLRDASFVFPADRRYPIHDIAHGRNALARVSQHGTPVEKKKVRSAVCNRFPEISSCKMK